MKLPKITISKVQMDGITGAHVGITIGTFALMFSISWAFVK